MIEFQTVFEPADEIVSMVPFKEGVILATKRRVYRMRHDPFSDTVAFENVVFHEAKDVRPDDA